jgi:hypothetical protein
VGAVREITDERGLAIMESYSPHAPAIISGELRLTPSDPGLPAFQLDRPDGDFFYSLFIRIAPAIATRPDIDKAFQAIARYNMERILIVVAALDRKVGDAQSRQILAELDWFKPFANVFYRELLLCRAIAGAAAEARAEIPQVLRDEREAWGRAFLLSSIHQCPYTSRSNLEAALGAMEAALKTKDLKKLERASPGMAEVLRAAFQLTHWEPGEATGKSNEWRRLRGSLRRDIQYALDQYRQSLKAAKLHLQQSKPDFLRPDSQGAPHLVGAKGRLSPLPIVRKS